MSEDFASLDRLCQLASGVSPEQTASGLKQVAIIFAECIEKQPLGCADTNPTMQKMENETYADLIARARFEIDGGN